MTGYKNLVVWQKSMFIVKYVYEMAAVLPKNEVYELSSQIRRAAVSIPANIAEGCGRQYKRETRQFLYIARGSLYELETLLDIARMTGMIAETTVSNITLLLQEELKLLNGLIKRYESSYLK